MNARRIAWATGIGVTAAAAASLAWLLAGGGDATAAEPGAKATATARVERRDLVQRDSFDGTLGYADARPLYAAQAGTLTRIAPEGRIVRRGDVVYEVDGKPVFLLYGANPAWRSLSTGVADGRDVRQLEQNLIALGYDPDREITLDETFDWATREAVERWEEDRGAIEDGVVEAGEVVFLPGARRIGAHAASLGGPLQPGAELMDTSSTRRVVTIDLDASRQDLVAEGDAVRVELPDGRIVPGSIRRVSEVAESAPTEQEQESDPTIEVTIDLRGAVKGGLDEAPVDVAIAKESKRDVLAVPVSALLALAGGGYALEVESESGRRLVAVEIGLFADGYVEVEGRGIVPGTTVVVPR
jgi:peptidoglycan hydrolase-like protein with peptidoglycan-binding domain